MLSSRDSCEESIDGWMKLAEERLKGTGISCYVSPGNDDFFEIDQVSELSDIRHQPRRESRANRQ